MDDMDLWLVGGAGTPKGVLLLKWQKLSESNRVRGSAELYRLDSQGIPGLRREAVYEPLDLNQHEAEQAQVIFPIPPREKSTAPVIHLPRQWFFRGSQYSTSGTLPLEIGLLRSRATDALGFMGLVPA